MARAGRGGAAHPDLELVPRAVAGEAVVHGVVAAALTHRLHRYQHRQHPPVASRVELRLRSHHTIPA
eukprot:9489613-Pyramimonas_sp.AAC.2